MNHKDTKDTKKKGKPAMRRWSCLKVLALIIGTVVGGFFLLVVIVYFLLWSGSVKPSLDAEFISTAEYLFAIPEPTPQYMNTAGINVDEQICVSIVVDSRDNTPDASLFWSEVIINNQRVGKADLYLSVLTTLPGVLRFCVENTLDTGLHIVEFRARGDWRQFLFSQQWAFEVE